MEREREPARAERDERARAAVTRAEPTPAARVLALQRSAGNAAVVGLLARQPSGTLAPPVQAKPLSAPVDYSQARADRDAFIQAGKKGPATYNPTARNPENYYGGFDVTYDPGAQKLQVTVKGAIAFLPGMVLKAGRAEAKEQSPQAAAAADAINALPANRRAAEVAKWRWSKDGGPDADDEKNFTSQFQSLISTTWQGKHPFHCTRRYWEDLGAETKVDVEIAEGAQGAKDHMKINALKVPATMSIVQADVSRTDRSKGAFGNTMNLNSSSLGPKPFNLLVWDVGFDPGTNTLTAAAKATLTTLGGEMPNAPAGATVPASDLTAKLPGADDAARQARFTAVRDALTATGMAAGRVKFEAAGAGDAGTVVVGDGRLRSSVAHEMGHMFGLDDEYTGTGKYAPGQKTEHTDFAEKAGFKGIQHARSDGIMGSGANVRAHHYVTFLDALKVVTGMEEWALGMARPVPVPAQMGDFPQGGPGGTPATGPPDTAVA